MTFHKATRSLSRQLDPEGELIPVRSIIDQKSFRPLCLVQRKQKTPEWLTNPFHKTDYNLYDLLLSEDIPAKLVLPPDAKDSVSITILDKLGGTLEGGVCEHQSIITAAAKGSASMSHTTAVKLRKIEVCPMLLHSVITKAKIDTNHDFIKQTKKLERNLYVITEAIETTEETQFEEFNELEGSIFYKAIAKILLMGSRKGKKAISVPKSCILAFRVKKLQIQSDGSLAVSYYLEDKTGTFDFIEYYSKARGFGGAKVRGASLSPGPQRGGVPAPEQPAGAEQQAQDPAEEPARREQQPGGMPPHPGVRTAIAATATGGQAGFETPKHRMKQGVLQMDKVCFKMHKCLDGSTVQMDKGSFLSFKSKVFIPVISFEEIKDDLQMESQRECMQFSFLARDLRTLFLTGFVAIMKDEEKDLLQTLKFQLEEALEDPEHFRLRANEPELQGLVENLQDPSGAILTELAGAVNYFLQALNELTEIQLLLLLDSVEKKIVSKELTVVKSILDHEFTNGERFTIDVRSLTEEELNITGAMIEMSRVSVEKTGPSLVLTNEPVAFSNLNALYVALYVLNLLST